MGVRGRGGRQLRRLAGQLSRVALVGARVGHRRLARLRAGDGPDAGRQPRRTAQAGRAGRLRRRPPALRPRPVGAATASSALTVRAGARVEGVVQGVGFRPYVHRLAAELGLAGFVLNDERGVLVEVEGPAAAVEAFLERLPRRGASAGLGRAGGELAARAGRRRRLRDPREPGGRRARRARLARHRHLRRLPGRAVRPGGPPLPLPVRQLHQLRAALHDRHRRPLRPAADHDGRLRDVPGLPGRVRRPRRPPLPRPAQRVPGVRAVARRLRRCRGGARRGEHRGGEGAGRLSPGLPGPRRGRPWPR